MERYSISQLAIKFGLSRSTLLHYDTIGLLKPATRSASNYRIYTHGEYKKLQQINSLRSTGISLEQIRQIVYSKNTSVTEILHKRIDQINNEIRKLRFQQNVITTLLKNDEMLKTTRIITKDIWVNLLESAGLDEEGMRKWHIEFELSAPEAHQDFLESIGLQTEEIISIREWSKNEN